jgi:hypothetical protein
MTIVEDRTVKKKEAPKKVETPKGSTTTFVPLSDVFLDYEFNARSRANVEGTPDAQESGGPEELSLSLRTKGQDFPVVLRPNTHEKGKVRRKNETTGHLEWWWPPYELVDGFRRDVAITALNADEKLREHSKETGVPIVPNVPNDQIAADVRPLDDLQATLLNGRAGIARNNLEPPDMMAHIVKLTRPPFSMAVSDIAEDQGLSLVTTHRYATAGNALIPSILSHWRFGGSFEGAASSRRLSFEEIEVVSKQKKEDQAQVYKDALIGKEKRSKDKDWLHTATQTAARMGTLLGRLEVEGVIRLTSKPWTECVDALVKLPAKTRRYSAVNTKMAETLESAYNAEKKRDIGQREKKESK